MRLKSEYLPVSSVGKLPCDGDHLRAGNQPATARGFDTWIREGRRRHLHEDLGSSGARSIEEWESHSNDETARETTPRRFLFGNDDADELLAGIIRPSTDSHPRVYPFSLFTVVPRGLYGRHYPLYPIGLLPVWEGLDDVLASVSEVASRSAFLEVIADARVPAPLSAGEAKERFDTGSLEPAARLFDRDDGASVSALRASLGEICNRLRKGEGKGPGALRMALPVSGDLRTSSFDASFWLDLLNRQFLMRRFEPSFFLDATPGLTRREVLFAFGTIVPEDYALVMTRADDRGRVVRPTSPTNPVPGAADAVPEGTFAELAGTKISPPSH